MTASISEEQWKELAAVANYRVNVLAEMRNLSVRQLQRTFRKQFACTPQAWLQQQRLVAARQMLLSGQQVKRVAVELGFKHSSHFCKQFKVVHGVKPSQFVLSCNGLKVTLTPDGVRLVI